MTPSQVIISGIIVALVVCVNLDQSLLAAANVERSTLLATLLMITLAGLLGHHLLFAIVLVVGLALAANLPPDLLLQYHTSPELIFATLLAIVIAPTGLVLLGWQPVVV